MNHRATAVSDEGVGEWSAPVYARRWTASSELPEGSPSRAGWMSLRSRILGEWTYGEEASTRYELNCPCCYLCMAGVC